MTISCCIKLFFYLTIVFLVIGCQVKQEKEISLGYDEFYFDEVLASLSEDENGDLWIGSETGDIFWFADNKIKKCFNLQVERIYKVLPMVFTPGDTSLLVGVRNSGLQYWRFRRDSFPTTKQFYIPHKNEEYSPYDFVKFGDILYVATSNGFYRVSLSDKNDEMELVFPTKEELYNEHNKGDYAIRNLVLQKDGTILGSSPRGIFYYNPERETRDSILLKIDNVEHVSIYRDTIFALANNAIYRYKDGNTISLPCKNMPQAYFEDSNDNKWLIASQSIRIGRNRLDEDFKEINLPRSIPLKGGRNVIVRSKLGHFSYLITRNALWRVPTHLNIYDHLKTVKAVSKDLSGILYFDGAEKTSHFIVIPPY